MFTLRSAFAHAYTFRPAIVVLMLFALSACATTPGTSSETPADATTTESATEATKADAAKTGEAASDEVAFVPPEPAAEKPAEQAVETIPVRIDVSCKNEPFSKFEKQARDSIAKGLAATKAGTYGVGFRDLKEHTKWSETHGKLFTAVNNACAELSKCAKANPKDKTKKCAQQAEQFSQWQALSKQFAEKAKQSETTQPPKICSFEPSLDDPAQCFHDLADNVDKACQSGACKETSDCWRGIGFLDIAINQAESACRFARQELSECRGYATATKRRKAKFQRCMDMQKSLDVRVIPVL